MGLAATDGFDAVGKIDMDAHVLETQSAELLRVSVGSPRSART